MSKLTLGYKPVYKCLRCGKTFDGRRVFDGEDIMQCSKALGFGQAVEIQVTSLHDCDGGMGLGYLVGFDHWEGNDETD